jgi:hypothetical protein
MRDGLHNLLADDATKNGGDRRDFHAPHFTHRPARQAELTATQHCHTTRALTLMLLRTRRLQRHVLRKTKQQPMQTRRRWRTRLAWHPTAVADAECHSNSLSGTERVQETLQMRTQRLQRLPHSLTSCVHTRRSSMGHRQDTVQHAQPPHAYREYVCTPKSKNAIAFKPALHAAMKGTDNRRQRSSTVTSSSPLQDASSTIAYVANTSSEIDAIVPSTVHTDTSGFRSRIAGKAACARCMSRVY